MSLPPRPSRSSRPASASEPTHAETVPQRELADFAGQALPDPRDAEAASSTRWLVGLGRRKGALLLMGAAVLTVAGMAWALATLLAPLGSAAAAVAAGLGMLLLMLPMMALLLKLAHQLERAHQMLQRLDTSEVHQPLPSRGQFIALVEREFARARRYGSGAGVAIVEVDRYRRLAELRGPVAGEAVMRELASLVG
jgi:diguanylate cyclase